MPHVWEGCHLSGRLLGKRPWSSPLSQTARQARPSRAWQNIAPKGREIARISFCWQDMRPEGPISRHPSQNAMGHSCAIDSRFAKPQFRGSRRDQRSALSGKNASSGTRKPHPRATSRPFRAIFCQAENREATPSRERLRWAQGRPRRPRPAVSHQPLGAASAPAATPRALFRTKTDAI